MIASRKALIVAAAFVLAGLCLPWGGVVPEASAQISVTAADPPTGEQGTLDLSVKVTGKGFKNGAKAKFYRTGTTDPAGVTVKSTQFVSSTELLATIDIADAAALAAFDILVANTDGRTGKGTGLFSVVQKKEPAPEYVAEFVDAKPDDPGWVPKIRGDRVGGYPADMEWAGPSFHVTSMVATGRAVTFQFDDPYPSYGSSFPCAAWGTSAPYNRAVGYPSYALSPDKIAVPDVWSFTSTWELTYNEPLGRWERIVESVTRRSTTYRTFDITGMVPGQKAYTMLVIWFRFAGSTDTYYVNFNDTFHRDLVPLDSGMRMNGGVVEVERDALADIWHIRPISSRFPVLGDPPALIPQNQANHALYDVPDQKADPGGNCNLGSFLMPFEIVVTRIR